MLNQNMLEVSNMKITETLDYLLLELLFALFGCCSLGTLENLIGLNLKL